MNRLNRDTAIGAVAGAIVAFAIAATTFWLSGLAVHGRGLLAASLFFTGTVFIAVGALIGMVAALSFFE